jgi:hypothetical protein
MSDDSRWWIAAKTALGVGASLSGDTETADGALMVAVRCP